MVSSFKLIQTIKGKIFFRETSAKKLFTKLSYASPPFCFPYMQERFFSYTGNNHFFCSGFFIPF